MDPVTGVVVASSVKAVAKAATDIASDKPRDSKSLRSRLLGPVFDELGSWMGDAVAARRKRNAESILVDAERIIEQRRESDDDSHYVNPRLLKGAIDDGSWSDSPMSHGYLAGLLVGGRSADGAADSNVPWLSIANAMSSAEVQLHFAAYRVLALAVAEDGVSKDELASEHRLWHHRIHVPVELRDDRLPAAVLGLRQSGLLAQGYSTRGDESYVTPTQSGVALFVAVHGVQFRTPGQLFSFEEGWNPPLDRQWHELNLTVDKPAVTWRENVEFVTGQE